MTTVTPAVNPNMSAKGTLLGQILAVERLYGCTPRTDLNATLNAKLQIFPNRAPANPPVIGWFCWGNGGKKNDSDGLSSAQVVSGLNLSLYNLMPFRVVPLESDLSSVERANYGLRAVVEGPGGAPYVAYYAKKLVFTESTV